MNIKKRQHISEWQQCEKAVTTTTTTSTNMAAEAAIEGEEEPKPARAIGMPNGRNALKMDKREMIAIKTQP